MDRPGFTSGIQPNSEYQLPYPMSQTCSAKRVWSKGKQPRSKIKVPKCHVKCERNSSHLDSQEVGLEAATL